MTLISQKRKKGKNFDDRKEKIFDQIESRGECFARQAHLFADKIIEEKKPRSPLPYKIKILESILEGDRPDFQPLTQQEIDQIEAERKERERLAAIEAKKRAGEEAALREQEKKDHKLWEFINYHHVIEEYFELKNMSLSLENVRQLIEEAEITDLKELPAHCASEKELILIERKQRDNRRTVSKALHQHEDLKIWLQKKLSFDGETPWYLDDHNLDECVASLSALGIKIQSADLLETIKNVSS